MSSVLGDLGSRECFATERDWQEYQDVVARLKMRTNRQVMDGQEIHPSRGFGYRQPSKRTRTRLDLKAAKERTTA